MSDAERRRRYRLKKKIEKYGIEGVAEDHRGKHGKHAKGEQHPRWAGARRMTTHGYVAVRVPVDFPHAWGPPGLKRFKYAYEHVVKMVEKLGRPLADNEVVHHRNECKTDNSDENLQLKTTSRHAFQHAELRGRDTLGRFL